MSTQSAPAATRTRERLEDVLVVDADVHVHEVPGEMALYCDMPWRKSLEVIATFRDDRYLSLPGFSPGNNSYHALFPGGHESTRAVTSASQMRDELSELSIDLAILSPIIY